MKNMFRNLLSINSRKNFNSYIKKSVSLLEKFTGESLINHGSALHCHLMKTGLSSQKYLAVKLLIMYLNSRKLFEIDQMLRNFNGFNLVVHNCLITANLEWGNIDEAYRLFDEMPERNEISWTALVSGLLKHGKVEEAMRYFWSNPFSNVFLWTATISGLVQNRLSSQAISLFKDMLRANVLPNAITFTSVVKACGELGDYDLGNGVLGSTVKFGSEHNLSVSNSFITFFTRLGEIDSARRIFDCMEEKDVISRTAILDVYIKMGNLREACRIFEEMPERNEVSWSAMIARLSQSGNAEEAVSLFQRMVRQRIKLNISCLSSVISALAFLKAFYSGRNIHVLALKMGMDRNVFVGSSLIDLYCKCGYTSEGRLLFDSLPDKNIVCWNSMVSGYSLNGQLEEAKQLFKLIPNKNSVSWNSLISGFVENGNFGQAFEVFNEMILSGERPNKSTFSSILRACASLTSLEKGKHAHAKAIKLGFQHDLFIATALVDMYAKSGSIQDSKAIFTRMSDKNEVVWTAMIQGLAENGYAEESLAMFEEMERTSFIAPNELIFLSVLFACSHCGLVDKGLDYFNRMQKVYGLKPNQRHYKTVVDMLSRSGRLYEAEKFIASMPFEPEANAWAALLNGCKKFRNEVLGEVVAEKMSKLAVSKPGGYVLMSNVYASAGRWGDVLIMRELMNQKGVKKCGGCSWIEVRNQVCAFYSQDRTQTPSSEIHGVLQLINSEI